MLAILSEGSSDQLRQCGKKITLTATIAYKDSRGMITKLIDTLSTVFAYFIIRFHLALDFNAFFRQSKKIAFDLPRSEQKFQLQILAPQLNALTKQLEIRGIGNYTTRSFYSILITLIIFALKR
jgi:hypothetical protein